MKCTEVRERLEILYYDEEEIAVRGRIISIEV